MAPEVSDWIQLSEVVRVERERQHLSQARLAQAASVSRFWLIGLEAGEKRSAPFDMIMRVLLALGISITLVPKAYDPPAKIDISASDIVQNHTLGGR